MELIWQLDIQAYHVWYQTDQEILNQELRYVSCIELKHSFRSKVKIHAETPLW